jgi:excisionase family DNA binding protein
MRKRAIRGCAVSEPLGRCLRPRELAKRWRVRPATIRGMIRRGELAAHKFGNGLRITPEAIAVAERGPLAVRPARRRRREAVPEEVRRMLDV